MTNLLIDMYSKCDRIEDVMLVFDHADESDEVSWNSSLSAYVHVRWAVVATNILVGCIGQERGWKALLLEVSSRLAQILKIRGKFERCHMRR